VQTAGTSVQYYVVPGSGSTNGNNSNTATITASPFRVLSVVVANSGALGTLNAGDTIAVTFSKAVATSTVTKTSVTTRGTGSTRGLYLPATSAATNATDVARVQTAANFFGSSATYAGTTAWSAGNTVWTWTSSSSGSTMTGALAGTWSLGTASTRAKCAADGTTNLQTTAPTLTGRW
jgi:hypothetical protein